MPELDLEALDRRARLHRLGRLIGWLALPLAFVAIVLALSLRVVGLAVPGLTQPMLVPLLLLSATPVPLGALLLHRVRLGRADTAIGESVGGGRRPLQRVWTARVVGIGLPLIAWQFLPAAALEALRLWSLRAAVLCGAMLVCFSVALPLLAAGADWAETRARGTRGSVPWLIASAVVVSLALPDPPQPQLVVLLAVLIGARMGWPALRAHRAIEAGDADAALWWTTSAPGLTGPVLHTRALRLGTGSTAEAYARESLQAWTPVGAVPRLLVHLAELAAERGEREVAWTLGMRALQLNPNLPQGYAVLAAADLFAGEATPLTLDLVERAREHASRGFPRQPGRRGPEYRALHAWALAATGNLVGATQASEGAWTEVADAPVPVRDAAEVYLERARPLIGGAQPAHLDGSAHPG